MEKKIVVTLLVWNNELQNVYPDDVEEALEDIRLSVHDSMDSFGNKWRWVTFLFPADYGFLKAEKEAYKRVYSKNKSLRCLTAEITFNKMFLPL